MNPILCKTFTLKSKHIEGKAVDLVALVDNKVNWDAIVEATRLEQNYQAQQDTVSSINAAPIELPLTHSHGSLDSSLVDRKWDKINPRYKQRLLMVFKIMKEQHGYELVSLKAYRSPEHIVTGKQIGRAHV